MAKLYITLAILCFCGAEVVKALNNWSEAIPIIRAKLNECKIPTGASEADVAEVLQRKPASTYDGKCLRACVYTKLFFKFSKDEKNNIIGAAITSPYKQIDQINIPHVVPIIRACYERNEIDDSCESADEQLSCMFTESKKYWP